jgi:hypothetical protein
MLISRKVGFNSSGMAIGAGFSWSVDMAPHSVVMMLPSENIDFIDYDVRGKTEQQIKDEVASLYPNEGRR